MNSPLTIITITKPTPARIIARIKNLKLFIIRLGLTASFLGIPLVIQAQQGPSFVTLTNTFIEEKTSSPETVIIPDHLYKKRNKHIIIERQGQTLHVITKKETLVHIDLATLGDDLVLQYRKRLYINDFYVFIRDQNISFKLTKLTETNGHVTKNIAPIELDTIHVKLDENPPIATPVLPEETRIISGDTLGAFGYPQLLSTYKEEKPVIYIFPPHRNWHHYISDPENRVARVLVQIKNIDCLSPLGTLSCTQDSTWRKEFTFALQTLGQPKLRSELIDLALPYDGNALDIEVFDHLANSQKQSLIIIKDQTAPKVQVYTRAVIKNALATIVEEGQSIVYFQDSIELHLRAKDFFSKDTKIKTARIPFAMTMAMAPEMANTTPAPIFFEEMDQPLLIEASTSLYYYSVDHFQNKSPIETLHLIHQPKTPLEKSITSE